MAGWKHGSFTMTYPPFDSSTQGIEKMVANARSTLIGIVQQMLLMGWTLDERFADAETPFEQLLDVTDYSLYGYYGAFILENSAGAKLLVSYGGGRLSTSLSYLQNVAKKSWTSTGGSTTDNHWYGGLAMSMLPPDSGEDFLLNAESYPRVTIPDSATRLVSTQHSPYTHQIPFPFNEMNISLTGTYHILTKGNVVIVVATCSNFGSNERRAFVVGEIFGSLAHSTDSGCGCTFGAFELSGSTGSNYEYSGTWSGGICDDAIMSVSDYSGTGRFASMTFLRADGSHVYGNNIIFMQDTGQLNSLVCSHTTGSARYVPFWMAEKSANPSATGVIPDDGFKGYISTDIIRCVRADKFTRGQLFDGGEFVYIGGGIALAWDASITESIF